MIAENLQLIAETLKNHPEQAKQETLLEKTPLNMILEKNDPQMMPVFEQNFQWEDKAIYRALNYALENLHENSNISIAQYLIKKITGSQPSSNAGVSPIIEEERKKAEEVLSQLKPYNRKTLPPFHIAMYLLLKHGDSKISWIH